jgi:prepilin-type N-terminal cleavage/methylation domain-containing protein
MDFTSFLKTPHNKGFTLSELLIALSMLGLIAAFAVPKVLTAVSDHATRATGKEAISMIQAAYDSYRVANNNLIGSSTRADQIETKLAYVKKTIISATQTDLILHSGATISFDPTDSFTGSGSLQGAMRFNIDPNDTNATNGPGAISLNLGRDGRVWQDDVEYAAGSGSTPHPFSSNYNIGTAIAAKPPSTAPGADTTWLIW